MSKRRGLFSSVALIAIVALGLVGLQGCPGGSEGGIGGRYIWALGGTGTDGDGGDGGDIEFYQYTSSDIMIGGGGVVNAACPLPSLLPDLGDNPRTVTMSETWEVGDELTAGSDTILGDDGLTTATGLRIMPGVTLTIEPNYPGAGVRDNIQLTFDSGVHIQGTVVTANEDDSVAGDGAGADQSDIEFEAESIRIAPSGRIITSGADNSSTTDGGDGGDIDLYGNQGYYGSIIVQGILDSTGGDGANGGDGGGIYLEPSYGGTWTTNLLDSRGGRGLDGDGGDGGDITAYGSYDSSAGSGNGYAGGPACNSGRWLGSGGDGTTGGGDAGDLEIDGYYLGAAINSGTLDASGGDATDDGTGGEGGDIDIFGYAGTVRVTGTIISRGGNGGPNGGDGGDGNDMELETYDENYPWEIEAGSYAIYSSANFDLSGGDGENGGDAGDFEAYLEGYYDGYNQPLVSPIMFVGYSWLDGSGGDGTDSGGDGSTEQYVYNYGNSPYDSNSDYFGPGNIMIQTNWNARGGNGGTGSGGSGGEIYVDTDNDGYIYPPYLAQATFRGDIDFSGGDSEDSTGGYGGYFEFYGQDLMDYSGTIMVNGGSSVDGDGEGTYGGYIVSDFESRHMGTVFANGGRSTTGAGGDGCDYVYIYGRMTTSHGSIFCDGGAAPDDTGGDGGYIEMWSGEGASTLSGTASVRGGAGNTDGDDGDVYVDGIHAQLTNGATGL